MTRWIYQNPVIELTRRCYGDNPEHVLDFADATDEEAQTVLEVLDEVEAEERARGIRADLHAAGHLL